MEDINSTFKIHLLWNKTALINTLKCTTCSYIDYMLCNTKYEQTDTNKPTTFQSDSIV